MNPTTGKIRAPKGRVAKPKLPRALIIRGTAIDHLKADMDTTYACLPCASVSQARSLVRAAKFLAMEEREQIATIESLFPSNWCDPILTGPNAAMKGQAGKWGCPDIEILIAAIKKDVASQVLRAIKGGRT